jgi:hypothetical protein
MSELILYLHEPGDPKALAAFEAEAGVTLPPLYKKLVGEFDEASIYPSLFFPAIPDAVIPNISKGARFDVFYDFETALGYWNGETYGAGRPVGMLFLGSTGGGVEVLMSLRPEDHGKIYCWPHTTNAWGTDGNDLDRLFLQADSLGAFLASLTDTHDRSGWADIDEEELEDSVTIDLTSPAWNI